MNKNNNLNNGFTTRKSVDGMVGVPRTHGVGGMINSNSSQYAPHGKILNKKTIQINPSSDISRQRATAQLNNKINPATPDNNIDVASAIDISEGANLNMSYGEIKDNTSRNGNFRILLIITFSYIINYFFHFIFI